MEPAQHEQRVLAGRGVTLSQSLDRSAAQWMVATPFGVEIRRLLPQLVGELVPAHVPFTAFDVEGIEERTTVEDR
jgi:hypothetical protein